MMNPCRKKNIMQVHSKTVSFDIEIGSSPMKSNSWINSYSHVFTHRIVQFINNKTADLNLLQCHKRNDNGEQISNNVIDYT